LFVIAICLLAACGPQLVGSTSAPAVYQPPLPPLAVGPPATTSVPPPATIPPTVSNNVSSADAIPSVPANQVLNVPSSSTPAAVYHEVVRGESLAAIGRKYGYTAEQLQKANGLEYNPVLQPGQLIFIPSR